MGAEPRTDELAGRTLGDFVLGERFGAGGFGAIYSARQPALERDAVIKVLMRERRDQDRSVERFLREAKLASRLDHPFAAHIYSFGAEPDGLLWIAMERVRGTTLREYLAERGPLSLAQFVPFFDRLAEVVSAAHDQGIVHRDLKPDNVMVISRSGRLSPKLLDLGIARIADADVTSDGDREMVDGPIDRLTRDDGITGSPHYMAPEQWMSPRDAGAPADQYALSALAFELLSGEVAFPGTRVFEVARAHAKKAPPRLPDSLPDALSDVLGKGLGKRPSDRYGSVAELAEAVRHAANLAPESMLLPELEPSTAASFVADGPQPIAAAVHAYASASTLARARSSLRAIARATLHYLAVLALATRARRGGGEIGDELLAELAGLRKNGVVDAGWLRLSALLTARFADRPDVHPIPELVMLFHGDSASPIDSVLPVFERGGDDDDRSSMRDHVSAIDALLARVRFLLDYPIAVRQGQTIEAWSGAQSRRYSGPPLAAPPPEAQPMCIDATGTVVAELYPLVQIAEPSAGAAAELFFVAGPGRRGARLLSHPIGHAIEDDQAWPWIADRLELDLGKDVAAKVSERAPYRGLAPFSSSDSDWFYGRETEAQALANRLVTAPLVAIVGPSGAGKSSFVRAGVVPVLAGDWTVLEMRPGHKPLAALAAALAAHDIEDGDPSELRATLVDLANRRGGRVLILVDQFEELFTLCTDDDARAQFAAALMSAAGSADDPVRVVFTLRDDFLMRAESVPQLGARLSSSLELLGTPSEDGLRRILVEPAKRAGFQFEDDDLVADMVAAVASKPGALPLLSFTAAKLWELRDRHFKTLSRVAYDSLGGVGGALSQHASEILQSMSTEEVDRVREAFRHLVTAEGTRAILSRDELEQLLGAGDVSDRVIERLIGGRLLVASESADGAVQIEITHEALLDAWPRLVEWRRQDAENARLRDQLRAAARQWEERARPRGLLWRSEALAEYQIWRARYPGRLTEAETAFGNASVSDAARLRNIRRAVLAIAFGALAIGLVVLYRSEIRAQASADESERRLEQFYREQGRRELAANNPAHAMVYLDKVAQMAAADPAVRYLYARARESFRAGASVLQASDTSLFAAAMFPDGKRIVTAGEDGVPRLWRLASGRLVRSVDGVMSKPILKLSMAPDGRFAVAGEDAFGAVFDNEGKLLHKLVGHDKDSGGLFDITFDAAGRRLATSGADGTVRVWDAASGTELHLLRGHEAAAIGARFSPDGQRLVTSYFDGTARVWDLSTGRVALTLSHHKGLVWTAQFTPDGRHIVTTAGDNRGAICDATTGSVVHWLDGHTGWVTDATISDDGSRIATVSRDASAAVYDASTGERLAHLLGHTGNVNRVQFLDDDRVATVSADSSVRIFSATTGGLEEVLVGHTAFIYDARLVSGDRLLTASWDGTARLWPVGRSRVELSDASDREIVDPTADRVLVPPLAAATPSHLALASDRNALVVRNLGDGTHRVIRTDGPTITAIAMSRDIVAVGDSSGRLTLFELTTGDRVTDSRVLGSQPVLAVVALDGGLFAVVLADGSLSVHARSGAERTALTSVDRSEPPGTQIRPRFLATGPRSFIALGGRSVLRYSLDESSPVERMLDAAPDGLYGTFTISADSDTVAVADAEGNAVTVRHKDGRQVTLEHGSRQMALALSGDGSRLLAGGESGEVTLWDTADGTELGRAPVHGTWVTSLTISPSGHYGLSTSADQRARIFDMRDLVVLDSLEPASGPTLLGLFVDGGRRAVVWATGRVLLWNTSAPKRIDAAESAEFARCQLGWELVEGRIAVRRGRPADCGR